MGVGMDAFTLRRENSGPEHALRRSSHPSLADGKFLTLKRHGAGVSCTGAPAAMTPASLLPRPGADAVPCASPPLILGMVILRGS